MEALNITDNILIQTFNSLPLKFKEETWDFMQFLLSKSKQYTDIKKDEVKRKFGYFPKGTFEMNGDFDAPLDCFKEYQK